MALLYAIPVLGMGAVMSIYGPMGNVPFFFVAFASSAGIALATGNRAAEFGKALSLPGWLCLAGVMSACMIIAKDSGQGVDARPPSA